MKTISGLLQVIVGVVIVGALAVGLVAVFQGMGGTGQAGVAATAALTGQPYPPYPPPQATITTFVVPTMLPPPPTPTFPPIPTPFPTPIVTTIPIYQPPIIPTPPGGTIEPFTIAFHDGMALHVMIGDADNSVVVDIPIQSPLSLISENDHNNIRPWAWGSLSPDKNQLAVVLADSEASTNIYLLNLSNNELRRLTQFGVEPVWSPDGAQIAYRDPRTRGLWVADVSTGLIQEIFPVETDDEWVDFFSWSPDSQKIALVKTILMLETGAIWIVDIHRQSIQLVPEEMHAGNIKWSPVGDHMLFISPAGDHLTPESPLSLWVVDAATGVQKQITQNMTVSGADWSPDGNQIVFTGVNLLEGGTAPYDLWLITKDGSELKRITQDELSDHYPFWASKSNRIIFRKLGVGIWELELSTFSLKQLYAQDVEYIVVR
jgi:WD40 repeat protein